MPARRARLAPMASVLVVGDDPLAVPGVDGAALRQALDAELRTRPQQLAPA